MHSLSKEFLVWGMTAHTGEKLDDGHPLPLLTILLYRVCGGEIAKFETMVEMLAVAFDAGQACALAAAKQHSSGSQGPAARTTKPDGFGPKGG